MIVTCEDYGRVRVLSPPQIAVDARRWLHVGGRTLAGHLRWRRRLFPAASGAPRLDVLSSIHCSLAKLLISVEGMPACDSRAVWAALQVFARSSHHVHRRAEIVSTTGAQVIAHEGLLTSG